ncbi:MAG: hypothetical protein WDZ28_02050 [Simkaniaceae bacterium]
MSKVLISDPEYYLNNCFSLTSGDSQDPDEIKAANFDCSVIDLKELKNSNDRLYKKSLQKLVILKTQKFFLNEVENQKIKIQTFVNQNSNIEHDAFLIDDRYNFYNVAPLTLIREMALGEFTFKVFDNYHPIGFNEFLWVPLDDSYVLDRVRILQDIKKLDNSEKSLEYLRNMNISKFEIQDYGTLQSILNANVKKQFSIAEKLLQEYGNQLISNNSNN